MLQDAHKTAAEDIERDIPKLTTGRLSIEAYWGAAFHWIAYGCQRKHGRHLEKHEGLVRYLRTLGETRLADAWHDLESVRIGGFYGTHVNTSDVQTAEGLWQEIRTWALS